MSLYKTLTELANHPLWVDDEQQLADLCQRWQSCSTLAIDTEFMRAQTFYPHAGLLQFNDGQHCYLVDPLAIGKFQPLVDLMANRDVVKVLHSCTEDLEVFDFLLGQRPVPLVDTQVAAAFAGFGFSIGYGNLVKACLGLELDKGETRSNWMQRPLSENQKTYAAQDVAYLLVLYNLLQSRLEKMGRWQWLQEDVAILVERKPTAGSFSECYKKIRSSWKLDRQSLAVLYALWKWREGEARRRDVPRNRVVKESAMWQLAKYKPDQAAALKKIEGLPKATVNSDGEFLLNLIVETAASDPQSWPEPLEEPLGSRCSEQLKKLKEVARARATELDLPVELLVRKKDYDYIVRSGLNGSDYRLPANLVGWRRKVVGDCLLEAVS